MNEDSPSLQSGTIVDLMARLRSGHSEAASELVGHLYPELRRLAAVKLSRQRNNYSWQPTLLVHELYLELTQMKGLRAVEPDGATAAREKAAFLSLAGIMMQRRLIEHARPLSQKMPRLDLETAGGVAGDSGDYDSLQYVEDLLARLEEFDPKLRTVMEYKVFMGMTLAEIGEKLGYSERTAASYWALARRWLATELEQGCVTEASAQPRAPLSRSATAKN